MKTLLLSAVSVAVCLLGSAQAMTAEEDAKIQYLITRIETLGPEVKFVRNGTEYDAKKAADHLRLKLKKAGDHVKTVDDFIELCATKSSVSGKPYQLKFPDGTTTELAPYLRAQLKARPAP